MTERPVAPIVYLIDVKARMPENGQRVQALTIGGVLVATQVGKDFEKYFDAWMPYPSVPQSVKDRQSKVKNANT